MESLDQTFNIQFVANITGINPHTIRAWEKRYQAILPQRDHNGRRLYSHQDIDRLAVLNKLVKMGNSISDIAALSSDKLYEIGEQYTDSFESNIKDTKTHDFAATLKSIAMGLEFFKLDVIDHELNKAAQELSSVDFALEIAAPMMEKIRHLKKNNQLSKDKRIQLYLILKSHLIKKIYQTKIDGHNDYKVVVAAAPGELNELGSMVATILFLDQGHEVDFLGGNVDAEYLGKICQQFNPDMLFIGINYSHDPNVTSAAKGQYLETTHEYLTSKTKVKVGAYDVCFDIPNLDYECTLDFTSLHAGLKKK